MSWIKKLLAGLAAHPVGWALCSPWAKVGNYLYAVHDQKLNHQKGLDREKRLEAISNQIFPDKEVIFGPFKGLKYPAFEAKGSALFPKLLGTYEAELHQVIEEICTKPYSNIINVGCGEGYYAVGLAKRLPAANILAFDIDEEAQRLTKKMAQVNNCENRVDVRGMCTSDFLSTFQFSGKALIICDCEGFEKDLFNKSISNLKQCDLLIETHDFIDITISSTLRQLFGASHNMKSIFSSDDLHKPNLYARAPIDGFSLQERYEFMREGRPSVMEWLYLTPKTNSF